MTNTDERIVVLVDMDCFFCQVEVKLQPALRGKPLAVVQYTQWQPGGIIAVNYEARDHGVSRHMRAEEAKKKCPNLEIAVVPGIRGKPDTSRYRIAGREVVEVLRKHSDIVERASVDEAYLDITELVNREMSSGQTSATEMIERLPNTFVIGYSTAGNNDEAKRQEAVENWINSAYSELGDVQAQRLAVAGTIVERIRADIYETTGYRCSAGISFNKILAKLACGLHKPNRQTILPLAGVPSLYQTLPVKKVRNLGGKFGDVVIESLGCNVMADLLVYSLKDLQSRFDEKTGSWLYNIARGHDNEPVTSRLICKSIGSCKNFPGKQAIVTKETLEHWVTQLSLEMGERLDQDLEENNRKATLLTVSYHYYKDSKSVNQSRSCRLSSYKPESIMKSCLDVLVKFVGKYPISFLGMSASKFMDIDKGRASFRNFFTSNTETTNVTEESSADTQTIIATKKQGESDEPENLSSVESEIKEQSGSKESKNKADEKTPRICDAEQQQVPSTSSVDSKQEIKSPMSLLRTGNTNLKPDNFKKSFFMNILNAHKNNAEKAHDDAKLLVENDLDPSGKDQCTDDNDSSEVSSENVNPVTKALGKDPDSVIGDETDSENGAETVRKSPKNEKAAADRSSSPRTEIIDEGDDNTIKLQDIFPDLNDIDESIVAALPPRLQKEANLILQSKRKKETESKVNSVKSSVQKSKDAKRPRSKPVAQSRVNKIDTFFNNESKSVQTSSNFNELVEKCPECDRSIPLHEYLEHVDFHVARNLSKEINKIVARGAGNQTPEKDSKSLGKPNVKRKRGKPNTREPEKRPKGIAAFFS